MLPITHHTPHMSTPRIKCCSIIEILFQYIVRLVHIQCRRISSTLLFRRGTSHNHPRTPNPIPIAVVAAGGGDVYPEAQLVPKVDASQIAVEQHHQRQRMHHKFDSNYPQAVERRQGGILLWPEHLQRSDVISGVTSSAERIVNAAVKTPRDLALDRPYANLQGV